MHNENSDLGAFAKSAWAASSGHEALIELERANSSPLQVFNLDLSSDFVASVLEYVDSELSDKRPDGPRNLGYSFLGNEMTKEIGLLVTGKVAAWRRLWDFAAESFLGCASATLAKYACGNALRAFTETGDDAASGLLEELRGPSFSFERYSDSELHEIGTYVAYYGDDAVFGRVRAEFEQRSGVDEALQQQWDNLDSEFTSQLEIGRELNVSSYHEVLEARVWKPDSDENADGDAITLGFLNYRNPSRPSSNIGDHVQTIGAIGQLRSFEFTNLDSDPTVQDIIDRNPVADRTTVDTPVRIVSVDRDFSVLQGAEEPIWLPVCGWFAHPVYRLNVGLPFASNINPIFMSFHVNNFAILTPETFEYLKAHEPIGCRDYLTVRTLREQGIASFFNGCVTLTLRDVYPTVDDSERTGRYYGAYNDKKTPAGYTAVEHLDRRMWKRTFNESLDVADDMLRGYQYAEDVTTPLLHCLLPCRSMGTPVEFTNPKEGDPRFQGLVDADDEMREWVADRFRDKYKTVMTAILAGKSRSEVYDVWAEACAPDIAATDELLASEVVSHPLPSPFDMANAVATVTESQYEIGSFADGSTDVVNLLFAFDEGFLEHFAVVMHSIVENTDRPINAHLFVRDVDRSLLETAVAQFDNVVCTVFDLSTVAYGDVNLMQHISVSTMDRLMAPEILKHLDRLVYLDVDILVRHDIGDLFDLEFDGYPLAARSGIDRRWSEGRLFAYEIPKKMPAEDAREFRARLFETGRTDFTNFNAGVLWMNLDELRSQHMSQETIGWATRFGLNDQYALNLFTRGDRGELPADWNHFSIQEFNDDPALIHFIGPVKPWTEGAVLPFIDEWHQSAAAVSGWQET